MNPEALKLALEAIRKRDRFEQEIVDLLIAKGHEYGPIIAYLRGRHFLDDARITLSEIERLSTKRGLGPERIRIELLQKGAPEHLVDQALADLVPKDHLKSAIQVLKEHYPVPPDHAKAWRYLQSKGFDEETCEAAVEQFLAGAANV